ncbi:MAG: monothiol glutaredoxin, Grx4 family, partial [Deltaproteobacteria bacterium]|nr:monothiol glutaredoxin, Grx4 family [Deltaproteobacteria bacterium]
GFSATVVQILDSLGVRFRSVDVLADPELREGIKTFSEWPTIPQLYVRREFLGGCDIVRELHASGELEDKLGVEKAPPAAPPALTVTPAAAAALRSAAQAPDEAIRLGIDARFQYELSIGPRGAGDVQVEAGGVTFLLDRASAGRASGTTIDFVETPQGKAFKITNPNEPPRVRQMSPRELEDHQRRGTALHLFDVRTPAERQQASISGSTLLDRAGQDAIFALPREAMLVFHCHHGGRSQQAAEHFLAQGFTNVHNLAGGIDAWSVEVDPKVPRY